MTIRKGDVWDVDTGKGTRTILVVSLDGLADAYGAVAVNPLQLSTLRFQTGTPHGNIGPEQQELVDNALRAVLDL
ncbi:hypothetical protein OG226_01490 [Streptomyces sp. NBC_01261]|uniref:hypothetical protein n=1 Tax=Streptomyces sp. NBC_01261 TaxID=2903802 RepID=UPI002E30A9F4|nr:hypothetical protein [Streptomyces sp. NBC_01261]